MHEHRTTSDGTAWHAIALASHTGRQYFLPTEKLHSLLLGLSTVNSFKEQTGGYDNWAGT